MPQRPQPAPERAAPARVAEKAMRIAWPSFVAACLLETAVFAAVDPLEMHWAGIGPGWSRQGIYSAAFFGFWTACALSSAMTAFLARPREEDVL